MTDFCIQIHTDRAPNLDLAAVREACAMLAQDKNLVKCFTVIEKGCVDHFNIMFKTEQPRGVLGRAFDGAVQVRHAWSRTPERRDHHVRRHVRLGRLPPVASLRPGAESGCSSDVSIALGLVSLAV